MNRTSGKLAENLRIIWAIAAKDILDAIRNKTSISVILGVAIMMLSSQALPLLLKLNRTPQVVVYDAGESRLVEALGKSKDLKLHEMGSQRELEDTLGESRETLLGLVIPVGLDQALEAGDHVELNGYFAHWVSESDATEKRVFFEQQLTELAEQSVRINTKGNIVYPQPDSDGGPFMVSMSLVIAIVTICGIVVPYSMVEEKETRTMDVLLVSPASISQVVVGKALAGSVYGLAAAGTVLAFNQAMVVHWGVAILATICGTLFAVAVSLLMGSIFDNPGSMNLWFGVVLMALMMPVLLNVMKVPSWPKIVTTIMSWIPTVALARVFGVSFSGSAPLGLVLPDLGIVVGSAALVLALVVWVVRRSDR